MMFSSVVSLSNPITVKISAQAPRILQSILPVKYLNIFTTTETPELWLTYESLLHSCLRTGDEKSANTCLQRLTERFGEHNERVMGIAGLYKEAIAKDETELEKILDEYESILRKDPTNMPISKRRIALLKSLERPDKAIIALNRLLDTSPNDAESWAELSDLYVTQGMYKQAIFALEELLLVTPYAWNIHARLGEVVYMSSCTTQTGKEKLLIEAIQCFCRSIELCDDYFRGFYGLTLVINDLQAFRNSGSQAKSLLPDEELDRLNELATSKLSEISQRSANCNFSQHDYSTAELMLMKKIISQKLPTRSKDR